MNKVINININGLVFYIDEDAFDVLNRYLESLKRHFKNEEGGGEILTDIESRIAEMLTERIKGRSEVVSMEDVNQVMTAMGQPEDMSEPEINSKKSSTSGSNNYFEPGRRMYRDPDNKIIGGVCSGISEYLGLDPVWIRLLFVAIFFGFGTGLLLYIILWAILPPAKTPSEKLEMRGERINISNIEKTVKENIDSIKDRIDREFKNIDKDDIKNKTHNFFEGLFEGISGALRSVFYVFGKILSFFLAFISIIVIVSVIILILGAAGVTSITVPAMVYDFFDNSQQATIIILLVAIVAALPFLGMLFSATRYLAGYKKRSRFIGTTFGILWLAAFISLIIFGFGNFAKFSRSFSFSITDNLKKPAHDTLYLAVNDNGTGIQYHGEGVMELSRVWDHIKSAGDKNDMGLVTLDITRADDRNISLEKYYHSRGRTIKNAHEFAEAIQYSYFQRDSLITFDQGFKIPGDTKWSGQKVDLELSIPDSTVVIMKKGMERIIFDIDNTNNIYDDDMIGHKWIMTSDGLTCLDCSATESSNNIRHHHHRHYWNRSWRWDVN
jgi:phage shock protein PspC (stress-responsive transcriptional regulator)